MSNNPWDVSNASVFMKFCCPECPYKCKALNTFKQHATKNHELSNILFNNTFSPQTVKKEPTCEIKQESGSGTHFMAVTPYLSETNEEYDVKNEFNFAKPSEFQNLKRKISGISSVSKKFKSNPSTKVCSSSNSTLFFPSANQGKQKNKHPIAMSFLMKWHFSRGGDLE